MGSDLVAATVSASGLFLRISYWCRQTRLCQRDGVLPRWSSSHRISAKGYLRAVAGQVKLVIFYWPNTGQRVANGTIPLQLRARNSNKTREQR